MQQIEIASSMEMLDHEVKAIKPDFEKQEQIQNEEVKITTAEVCAEPEQIKKLAKKRPLWMEKELNSNKVLKQNIRQKYNKDIPQIEDCENACLAQVLTDDIYFKIIVETLNAAGDRSNDILKRAQIAQGISELKHFSSQLTYLTDTSKASWGPKRKAAIIKPIQSNEQVVEPKQNTIVKINQTKKKESQIEYNPGNGVKWSKNE